MKSRVLASAVMCALTFAGFTSIARAEMVLSQVIVDLMPGGPPLQDIEVWNDGDERMFVSAEPFQILDPGTSREQRVSANSPDSGLLVSPQRLVLAPGERRIIRVAAVGERSAVDRVYRVAIQPVAGNVSADATALKVFVGYDALVLVRPDRFTGDVVGQRSGHDLLLRNDGNTAQELFDGRQCDSAGNNCQALPAKRLYPGVEGYQNLPYDAVVTYKVGFGSRVRERTF